MYLDIRGFLGTQKLTSWPERAAARISSRARCWSYAGLVKSLVSKEAEEKHQLKWEKLTNRRQAMEFLVGCNANTSKFLLGLSRAKLRRLVG